MIWLIGFLVVWVLANVFWNYKFYKEKKFLCLGSIFQGLFAGIPSLVWEFSEWMAKYKFWTKPIFMNKQLKDDIEFLKAEQKARMEAICQKIDTEIKNSDILEMRKNIREEVAKGNTSLKRDWEKEEPKKKSSGKKKEKK